ncbi:MAG: hypothetical protein ABJC63_12350, partial [Gemmatimonadales bacterium]
MRRSILALAFCVASLGAAACTHSAPANVAGESLSAMSLSAGPRWTTRFRNVAPSSLDRGDS